jgi:glycosyltransferase involved in cell wall biosynthesis
MIDIFVLTYNRLPYLQKCIWSILASTDGKYRLVVLDDGSDDGTREWLLKQRKRKLLELVFPKKKLGTAEGFNTMINAGKGEWFVFANDDMWFHKGWLANALILKENFDDCGYVSMYDYTNFSNKNLISIFGDIRKVKVTGLGATLMYRPLWAGVGGFKLPNYRKMGFFATKFCQEAKNVNIKRNQLYVPAYFTVHNMDLAKSKLSERDVLADYIAYRQKAKGKDVCD